MAECRCGQCSHCLFGVEPDAYAPDPHAAALHFGSIDPAPSYVPPFGNPSREITPELPGERAAFERSLAGLGSQRPRFDLCRHDILREDCREGCAEDFPAPIAPAPTIPAAGHPVRDLADAIRAIALADATGRPISAILLDALALANRLDDGTHGCDTCRRVTPTSSGP